MNELEERISNWRTQMAAALPGQEDTLRELESHLRDHIESLRRRGMDPDAAFAESVVRLGEVHGLAREFGRVRSPWWPRSWLVRGVLLLLGAGGVALMTAIAGEFSARTMTPLLGTHVLLLTCGYLSVFGGGLIGLVALVKAWRRPLAAAERRELRAVIFRLSAMSCVLVPLGIGLGMVWAAQHRGAAWSWERVETGALCVLISAVLLFVTQWRGGPSDRLRWVLAAIGGVTVIAGMFGAKAVTPAVPIGWLWLALLASQGAVLLLRARDRASIAE